MGACVIAEGIETIETLDFVRRDVMSGWHPESGIRGVQGYLLGRPAHAPWTVAEYDQHAAFVAPQDLAPPKKRGRRSIRTGYRRVAQPARE
jgi:EAL domain-containing protein (putative c-di-GMP-specific phosphodiesterase class I)